MVKRKRTKRSRAKSDPMSSTTKTGMNMVYDMTALGVTAGLGAMVIKSIPTK